MKINKSNVVYVFRDNEKEDCPENLISHVCLDDAPDLRKWFEENLNEINENYFIQFLFESGSVIKAYSAKKGFLKLIRFWYLYAKHEFRCNVDLQFWYCVKRGSGNSYISFCEFIDILFNEEVIEGKFSKIFRPHGVSPAPDKPKEPNIISDLRIELNKDLQMRIFDKIPDFHLSHLKIKPYEIVFTTERKSFNHLISNKQDLLSYLEKMLQKFEKTNQYVRIDIDFRNENNEKLKGEHIYLLGNILGGYTFDLHFGYCEFKLNFIFRLYLKNVFIDSKFYLNSLEDLVKIIFFIPKCDKNSLKSFVTIKDFNIKKPKAIENCKKQKSESFSQAEMSKLEEIIDFVKHKIIRFEGEVEFMEIFPIENSKWSINFYYPSTEEPIDYFKKNNIDIPKSFELNFWEANHVCTFMFNTNETKRHLLAKFVGEISSKVMGVNELSSLEISHEV